jgi:hypothetical protein
MMPLGKEFPLKGEMPVEDFAIDTGQPEDIRKNMYKKIGLFEGVWLWETISGGYQWSGGQNHVDHMRAVAEFCNNETNGPYFIIGGYANTKDTLSYVFFDRADAENFMKKFHDFHYKLEEDSFAKNIHALIKRHQEIGWNPVDERLLPYLQQGLKGLAPTAQPAPILGMR